MIKTLVQKKADKITFNKRSQWDSQKSDCELSYQKNLFHTYKSLTLCAY